MSKKYDNINKTAKIESVCKQKLRNYIIIRIIRIDEGSWNKGKNKDILKETSKSKGKFWVSSRDYRL